MTTNGLMVTVVGWAATTPREVVGDGVPFTSFRVATTPRYFDGRKGAWADGRTEWITVKAFRDAAFNVAASISKSDPVVIHGRLLTEEWVGENGPRTTLVLEANAIGHDLSRGTAKFARRVRVGAEQAGAAGQAGPGAEPASGEPTPEDPWAVDAQVGAVDGSAARAVGQDQVAPTP
jgi:single-strand DNA-binding protein